MWRGCLQAVRSTQTDRRVRKHARRTWSVSAQHEGDRVAGVSYAQRLKWKIRGGELHIQVCPQFVIVGP